MDLLDLCQTVTEDGSISGEEVGILKKWLDENRPADLPAITLLINTIEQILEDGKITPDERKVLHKAIETVLPIEIRADVISKRRASEKVERELEKEKREAEKESIREERERNSPIDQYDFMVAGVRYGNRENVIQAYVSQGDDVLFMRERDNEHSRNAILIRLPNGMDIGYVPEECAMDMAPLLDRGQKYRAFVKKILSGGQHLIPVIIANFYRPDANAEGIKTEVQGLFSIVPPPSVEKSRHRDDTWVPPNGNKSRCLIGGVSIITFAVLYISHGCADIFRRLMSKFPTHWKL